MGAFASFKWTGASGQQIGFADADPYSKYGPSFTADEVHGQAYNPNTPNMYQHPGGIGEVPVIIQDDYPVYTDGSHGWLLDNLTDPWHSDDPGTRGHSPYMAGHREGIVSYEHEDDVYQIMPAAGNGQNIFASAPNLNDAEAYMWKSSSTPAPNTRTFPAEARERTENWPEPFDSYSVAPIQGVLRPNEHINMNRMLEDDRPVYRQLAIPGQNIRPSGSVYNPTMPSNPVIHNVKPLPAFNRTPVPPWSQDELASPSQYPADTYVDVFDGMGLQ